MSGLCAVPPTYWVFRLVYSIDGIFGLLYARLVFIFSKELTISICLRALQMLARITRSSKLAWVIPAIDRVSSWATSFEIPFWNSLVKFHYNSPPPLFVYRGGGVPIFFLLFGPPNEQILLFPLDCGTAHLLTYHICNINAFKQCIHFKFVKKLFYLF